MNQFGPEQYKQMHEIDEAGLQVLLGTTHQDGENIPNEH
jgi:hypothetical protein